MKTTKTIRARKYFDRRKDTSYFLQAYLINKKDKTKLKDINKFYNDYTP
jgi:hypothetical protein